MSRLVNVRVLSAVLIVLLASVAATAQDADKKKPPVEGTLKWGSQTHKLAHGIAYTNKRSDDDITTEIRLTSKPFPTKALAELKQQLQKTGNDDEFFIFDPFLVVFVSVDAEKNVSVNIMLEDGGGFNIVDLEDEAKVVNGRVVGFVKMPQPDEVFDTKYQLDVKFDLEIMK